MKLDLLFVRFLTILALAVGGLAIVPSDAHADPAPHWTSLGGPEGGWVAIIAIDPGSPSNVYAGTRTAGVFRSTDGGQQWNASNDGIDSGNISALEIDPVSPSTIFAAARTKLYRSLDSGVTWIEVLDYVSPTPYAFNYISDLAIDPATPTTIYGRAGTSVFGSVDGGDTWSDIGTVGFPGFEDGPDLLVIDPETTSTLFATSNNFVYRSTNTGVTWDPVLVVDWISLPPPIGPPTVHALAIDPNTPDTVYASSSIGMHRSDNGGTAWEHVGGVSAGGLTIHPDSSAIYGSGRTGIGKSIDGGETWEVINQGLGESPGVLTIAIDPSMPSRMFLGASDSGSATGVFRSEDGGDSWAAANSGLLALNLDRVVVDSNTPSTLFTTTRRLILRSTDTGASWSSVTPDDQSPIESLAIDLHNPGTIFSSFFFGDVLRSRNNGDTWDLVLSDCAADEIRFTSVPDWMYLACNDGDLYASFDGGDTWLLQSVRSPASDIFRHAFIVDPFDPLNLYAGLTFDGMFRSTDGGANWFGANDGLLQYGVELPHVDALAADPDNEGVIYTVVSTSPGLFRTSDAGYNWLPVGQGRGIKSLLIDPNNSTKFFGNLQSGGVLRSQDGGTSWVSINDGLGAGRVLSLVNDQNNPAGLYAVTRESSVVYFNPNLPDSDDDTRPDAEDNCPAIPNPNQEDNDTDGDGDACDDDDDNDGVNDAVDSCPLEAPLPGRDANADGCTDTLDDLVSLVESLDLQPKIQNGLLGKLNEAQKALARGNTRVVGNKLRDFKKQVEAQRGKALSEAEASLLIDFANNLIALYT